MRRFIDDHMVSETLSETPISKMVSESGQKIIHCNFSSNDEPVRATQPIVEFRTLANSRHASMTDLLVSDAKIEAPSLQ